MTPYPFQLAGGIGLFLLGMSLLTDGLRAYAGKSLRQAMIRFTGTPLRAFLSGVFITALIQSSSATTVTAIGFVSAGILTFAQALGVVLGASLGTTATGWMVAVLGLKISLGLYALPLIAIGAFIQLLARGRARQLGLALAGFGLIFVGIESLQRGMEGFAPLFDLAALPSDSIAGTAFAAGIGFAMTLVMQSSSAAIATTLTALHAGAIQFEQAAAVAIGASIGTTVTGVIAAIGGSPAAKRTALAHVLFNLVTGVIAFLLLPQFLQAIAWGQEHAGLGAGAISIAAFHTRFTLLGVLVFLPLVRPFAELLVWMVPERGPALTRKLDRALLQHPAVALEAVRGALIETACALFEALRASLSIPRAKIDYLGRIQIQQALEAIEGFIAQVPADTADRVLSQRRTALVHALDHLMRMRERLDTPPHAADAHAHAPLQAAAASTVEQLHAAADGLAGRSATGWAELLQARADTLEAERQAQRAEIIEQTAEGRWMPERALEILDWLRWHNRVGHHIARVCVYLDEARLNGGSLPYVVSESDLGQPE
ncbi:MAG: Na/Pi cotransporter family protein [Candidatus Hydrogenedens sp.]|nr:Na/Pi cotransporter family protein [Candidatus Hydrogenedens sp.]